MKTGRSKPFSDQIEESLIALLLGLMTAITFVAVVLREMGSSILWGLEATVYLFAWLVLLGASYGVKHTFHIGVDIVANYVSPAKRKILTLTAVALCLLFSLLLLKGSWDYWYPFVTKRAWLETNDIPMPEFLQFFADWLNEGERYEKMPRFIPYAVLPLSTFLMTVRFLQAGWNVLKDKQELIIASHEVEEQLYDMNPDEETSANGESR